MPDQDNLTPDEDDLEYSTPSTPSELRALSDEDLHRLYLKIAFANNRPFDVMLDRETQFRLVAALGESKQASDRAASRLLLATWVIIALTVALLVLGGLALAHDWNSHQSTEANGNAQALPRTLALLSRRTANVRDSGLRLEFELPLQAYLTQALVAVETGNLECPQAKRLWQNYVDENVIPSVNKPENRDLKAALKRTDPGYHRTLLNSFTVDC